MEKYQEVSYKISQLIIKKYSTSFYWASLFYKKSFRKAIFSIYGFVRFADEIVDTFHDYPKKELFDRFKCDWEDALKNGISLNPVLHAFMSTVKMYQIDIHYIRSFLESMQSDLGDTDFRSRSEINKYIYGSAEVVGLMCLKIFCKENELLFRELESYAIKLGAAFQKVNFLRDLNYDIHKLNRLYFPEMQTQELTASAKSAIISDLENDFRSARKGIARLPHGARLPVIIAFYYYKRLLFKIKKNKPAVIINKRIRVSNIMKLMLVIKAFFVYKFRLFK